jgi:hypothetical protein
MERSRLTLLLGIVLAVLVMFAAFLAGIVAFGGETVVTAQSGNATGTGDGVVLVVRGEAEFADRVETRLEDRLAEEGYGVSVARGLEGHAGPVLVVDIVAENFRGDLPR